MLRSLNAGVSGLKAFQTKLDIIGNNIANVNTVGYKKSQVVFEDLFSQTLKGASAPAGTMGGTNPIQVGLGTRVSSINNVFTPGSPMSTYNQTDLYIDGDGFFAVSDGTNQFLTRSGNFTLDKDMYLVNSNGMRVLDSTGSTIQLPAGSVTFSVTQDGTITGVDSSGVALTPTKKIATVSVVNPKGLEKQGSSLYSLTPNADSKTMAQLLTAGSKSQIIPGVLEMSNVDLSEEMTDMITAQRGFQANAKIITVSDSILEELVNLKR
jgi:flagellar hook protein FlgE